MHQITVKKFRRPGYQSKKYICKNPPRIRLGGNGQFHDMTVVSRNQGFGHFERSLTTYIRIRIKKPIYLLRNSLHLLFKSGTQVSFVNHHIALFTSGTQISFVENLIALFKSGTQISSVKLINHRALFESGTQPYQNIEGSLISQKKLYRP